MLLNGSRDGDYDISRMEGMRLLVGIGGGSKVGAIRLLGIGRLSLGFSVKDNQGRGCSVSFCARYLFVLPQIETREK